MFLSIIQWHLFLPNLPNNLPSIDKSILSAGGFIFAPKPSNKAVPAILEPTFRMLKNGASQSVVYKSYAKKTGFPVSYGLAEFGRYQRIQKNLLMAEQKR
jgi:hypothetical protein